MVAVVIVVSTLLLYHTTGAEQRGYNRFSMDYMAVVLAVVAPDAFRGRRKWLTVVMVAWSVGYFHWLL
jgi:hypothetical protein